MSMFGDYVRQQNSVAQQMLESQEGLLRDKSDSIRSQATEQANLLQTKFSDVMSMNTGDFMKEMGIEQTIPGALKLAQSVAKNSGRYIQKFSNFAQKAEDTAGEMSQRLQPQKNAPPQSDDIEMEDLKPDEVKSGPITQEDIPSGAGGGKDVSNLGPKQTDADVDSGLKETDVDTGLAKEDSAEGLGEDLGEGLGEDLGEEAAATIGESVGEAIGAAIPIVGWIGDLAGLIGAGVALSKTPDDPFNAMKQQIQSANSQTEAIQAKVSADQFQQRIGAGMPSFGSLALAGQRASQTVALHD